MRLTRFHLFQILLRLQMSFHYLTRHHHLPLRSLYPMFHHQKVSENSSLDCSKLTRKMINSHFSDDDMIGESDVSTLV